MKNQIIGLIVIAISIIALSSCETPAPAPKEVKSTVEAAVFTPSVRDTISVTKFNLWKKNWNDHAIAFLTANSPDILNSFTVKKVDLTEVMGESPTQVRYYLGLEAARAGGWEAHMMIVGVNASGGDMIDYSNGQYVYDMVCPCPVDCSRICTN